jgi:hypothetical protein
MRELKLKYVIELASNLGAKSRSEAQVLEDAQRRMNQSISRTADQVMGLERAITKIGHNSSTERQIGYLQRLGQAADAAGAKVLKAKQAMARGMDAMPEKFGEVAGGYYGAKTMMAPPINAFAALESATQDLRISMTDAKGKVSADFEKISIEAGKLGNQLPGTTKDYMMAARALQTQGVKGDVIANGGLQASSYVGALLDMNQAQSAEIIAKLREAHSLKADELVDAADLVQRGFFGFGIKPQDYLETAKYAASTYNTMGITGRLPMKETLAIQGMAAGVGLDGSSFGTNYAMMLRRTGEIDTRMNKKSKEAKEIKEMLGEHGIDMNFYNEKGQFGGNRNMLEQLAKLRKLNPLEQQKVLTRLFGVEAGRPAQILVQKGLEGYDEALKTIDNQASLDQRIGMKMETLSSKLESLRGTLENVLAKMGTQAGNALKPISDGANSLLGGSIGKFFEANPAAGTAGILAGGAAGALLLGRFGRAGGALVKSLIARGAPAAGALPAALPAAAPLVWPTLPAAAGAVAGGLAPAAAHGGAAAVGASAAGTALAQGAAARAAPALSAAATAGKLLKFGGITAGIGGVLEGASILADEKADKGRDLTRVGLTGGMGVVGGALSGAAVGSVLPGIGTIIGAIVGGVGASLGSGALFDLIWEKKAAPGGVLGSAPLPQSAMPRYGQLPQEAWPMGLGMPSAPAAWGGEGRGAARAQVAMGAAPALDFLRITAPQMAAQMAQPGKTSEIKIGDGILNLNVRISDERVSVVPSVAQQPSLIRINAGSTNPGGYR